MRRPVFLTQRLRTTPGMDRLLLSLGCDAPVLLQVLIFSQMTKMLDLLHYYLEERGFDPCRIDGSIPWEERMVRTALAGHSLYVSSSGGAYLL